MLEPAYIGRSSSLPSPSERNPKPLSMSSMNNWRSGDFRFVAGTFQYNVRVAIALVPCLVLLLGMGGKAVLGTLTIGLMVSYILDALHIKHGPFFGVWGSILASQVALILGGTSFSAVVSKPLYCLALFTSFEANFLLGVWASLQFRWLQLENPSVVLILERVLFACTPFTASTILTWGAIAAVGMHTSAFYLMVILGGMYWLFSLPHQSSFRSKADKSYGGQIAEDALILGPLDAAFHTLTMLFLPLLFYIASHHALVFSSVNAVCNLCLLFFIPLLFQLYATTRGALWWLAKDPRQFHQVRLVVGALCLFVIVICLEIRVVFYSFGQYIQIPAPWSYFFVTVALLGGSFALGAYVMGLIGDAFSSVLLTVAMMIAAFAGSLVVGLPLKFLPAPLVSAFYISHFCVKKNISSYFIAVITAAVPVTWFVLHNYWHLNIWLGGVPLKTLCKIIIASILLAMTIPGLLLLPRKAHLLVEGALIGQAILLCNLENRVYNFGNMYHYGGDEDIVYPSYMVLATTGIGLLSVRRLEAHGYVGSWGAWLLICLYSAKLSMLFLSSKSVVWASSVLLLVISPPLLLYKDKGKGVLRMKPWQGFSHAAAVCIAIWLCRYTVFEALQWWLGHRPSDGLIFGFLVVLTGLACVPIITRNFSHVQSAKRVLVLVVAIGLLLVFLQPPLPKAWSFWWDSSHMPEHLIDDAAIYGLVQSRPTWPSWILVGIVVLMLAAFTSAIPVQYVVGVRLVYAVGLGALVGIYVCLQYFTQALLVHVLLVVATICASVFLVFTHLPSASSPLYLPWVFSMLVTLLPVIYLIEGQLRFTEAGENDDEKLVVLIALEGSRTGLLGLYAAIFMLIALQVKYELATLLKDKALEIGRSRMGAGSSAAFVPKYRLLPQRRASISAAFSVKKLASEGAWMPVVGNVATSLCFASCLVLNMHLTGGSNRSIFLLAPILLLLNQDYTLLAGFGDRQRYFPLTLSISIYLSAMGCYKLWEEVWHGYMNSSWGLESGSPGLFFALKNLISLFLTLPNQIMFNRFMWDYVKQSDFLLLLITPLNLPALIITDVTSVRVLAVLGIIYALTQYSVSRHVRIAGMKLI